MNKKQTLLLTILLLISWVGNAQNSAKISRVLEYHPAPGQHINRLFPTADKSNTYEDALAFASNALVGNKSMLGLGAFGGYVIVGFDHSIVNQKGEYDFKGFGNSFKGSHEPGAVMVCQDLNKNGKPDEDEPWYELAGSAYNHTETIHDYEVTYYRPSNAREDVRWRDNQGVEGTVKHISFATQDHMYPNWIAEDSITFKGTKLRNTAHDTSGNGTYWVMDPMDYGYIDNNPNNDPIEKNGFKIDWAVNDKGESVELEYIDFIKIYTAQQQEAGWLGETSTEVVGIEDLHPELLATSSISQRYIDNINIYINAKMLTIATPNAIETATIIRADGTKIGSYYQQTNIDISHLPQGIYVVMIRDNENRTYNQKILIQK